MFLMLAASKVELDASMDEEDEIEEGLQDLDEADQVGQQGRRSPYWAKIRERLIEYSSSDNIDDAVREWAEDGHPFISNGVCELCDKRPIKFHFPIRNRVTGKAIVVGCECIHNYLVIPGYESAKVLRKRLQAQLSLLRKQEKGEVTDEDFAAVTEALKLEGQVRARIASISGGNQDFDLREYIDSLWEVYSVAMTVGLKKTETAIKCVFDTYQATNAMRKLMGDIKKKSKNFTSTKLGELASAISRQRDAKRKAEQFSRMLQIMNSIFSIGMPDEVISRGWKAVSDGKSELVTEVQKKADLAKAALVDVYKDELNLSRPYDYLRFLIVAGIEAMRKNMDAQVETIRKAVEGGDFFDQTSASRVGKLINTSFYPDFANGEGPAEKAAQKVCSFLGEVAGGRFYGIIPIIQEAFGIREEIRDWAGVKTSLLRAAEDSIIDADIGGDAAISDFSRLVREKDKRVIAILKEEVDEIAAVAKATGNMAVHEMMTKALGFNVEKAYKLYSSANGFESKFCGDIFARWKGGRLTALSPGQMGNINKQMSMKGARGEVPDSMWSELKSQLTARATPL